MLGAPHAVEVLVLCFITSYHKDKSFAMFTGGVRFHTAVVLLIQRLVVVACVTLFMVSPDVVGIGSEYFVVYFRMYIYVRLVMSGYPFFCIYFNAWYITCYPK